MLSLYSTLEGKKEEFKPITPKKVGMYVCGPTVYDYDHLGHARTYLAFDLLHRLLRYQGYEVNYVQNITDVGHLVNDSESGVDKIKQKAQETGESPGDIVRRYTEAHFKDLRDLNVLQPTTSPKASENIKEIIQFVEQLIEKKFAYVTDLGNVYFSVARKSDYGKLSRRGVAEILTGTRVESAQDKRSSADFAMWKAAPHGNAEMTWESPWGRGFPGWHIECSAMSQKYLGDTFDIHGAAVEHVFPHHENEIAQSEAANDKPLANYWVHSGMLTINGSKMSKSTRNTVTVQDALKTYSSNEIRLAMYLTHYRKPFDFTKQAMQQGVALRGKLFSAYASELPDKTAPEVLEEVIAALEDDLDSPQALQVWSEGALKVNRADSDQLFAIFGLSYKRIEDIPRAKQLADEREQARSNKDFLTADNRKAEIAQMGFEVLDAEGGTVYLPH